MSGRLLLCNNSEARSGNCRDQRCYKCAPFVRPFVARKTPYGLMVAALSDNVAVQGQVVAITVQYASM